jgi:hypothetical protein
VSLRVLIPFTECFESGIEPSPAWGWHDYTGDEDEPTLFLRCACGMLTGLGKHTIADNGDVSPSIYHQQGCGWHVFGTLVGWKPKA